MALQLMTAGESHGPALIAIVTGLPAGLVLEQEAIDADLHRRQQGYGRSPRQQIEQDEVEVLAGLRHGRTLGTPLALVVRNRDHKNWEWGMSAWPPEGEPAGKGTRDVTLPRPGHADLAGTQKYGFADVRDVLERASARHTAVIVAAGAVAKALIAELGIAVEGRVLSEDLEQQVDEARADRDTVGGVVEVRARGVPPAFLHMDVDWHSLQPGIFSRDMKRLQTFAASLNMPFGIIIVGYNGEADPLYAFDVGALANVIADTFQTWDAMPDHIIFQSWVVTATGLFITPSNLPEGQLYTHTNSLWDLFRRLRGAAGGPVGKAVPR